jgi:predicted esterase
VKAGQPPLFLSHDHNDQVVPYPQAARLAAQVEAVGNDVDLYAYDGPGHVMWRNVDAEPPRLLPGIEERLLAFLERTR